MSKTNKGSKGPGYEYWSTRPGLWYELGPPAKRRTAKAERREAKEECQYNPPEDFQCVRCGNTVVFDYDDICTHCTDEIYAADECLKCGGEKNPFARSATCEDCNKELTEKLDELIKDGKLDGDY